MKKYFSILFLILFSLSSCKKNVTPMTKPTASFNVISAFFESPYYYPGHPTWTIGIYDTLIFKSNSLNASSVMWDFGNGKTANTNTAGITYDSAGIYNITLTALDRNVNKDTATMKIVVKERVIQDLSIDKLNLNSFAPSQNGLPVFSKLDLWLVLKYSNSATDTITNNGDVNAQIMYKSPVFSNIDSSFHSSIKYTVPPGIKATIKCPLYLPSVIPFQGGLGLFLNLYGKDDTGTYLLASSRWSGIGLSFTDLYGGNPNYSNTFGLQTYAAGSTTTMQLNCRYQ